MRFSFLMAACAIATGLHAQPVLDSNDLPQGGTTYVRATAIPPFFTGDLDAGSADVTWDYSDLEVATEAETPYFPMSEASFTTQFIFSSADHFTAFNPSRTSAKTSPCPSVAPRSTVNSATTRTAPLDLASPPTFSISPSSTTTKRKSFPTTQLRRDPERQHCV